MSSINVRHHTISTNACLLRAFAKPSKGVAVATATAVFVCEPRFFVVESVVRDVHDKS